MKITGSNRIAYDFSDYKTFTELYRDIYQRNISVNKVEMKQDEFNAVLNVLSRYAPRKKCIY